ncbi:MAG: immune inhibitor A [Dehalococcoidia bacterium]|nr:immune inhibitor A [Dehalococcoidia bacterium]MDW8120213.1 immune inhibitor A [Chloroflexota bacterium]
MRPTILGILILILLTWGVAGACTAPPPTPTPTSSPPPAPTPTPAPPLFPTPPDRDLYDLTQRYRTKGVGIPRTVAPPAIAPAVGMQETFWAIDLEAKVPYTITATLRAISPHAYWYIADGVPISDDALQQTIRTFEERIVPQVGTAVGGQWPPGINGDPRLTILYGPLRGAAGYYSGADEYPLVVHPYSNQRRMLYLNSQFLRLGSSLFDQVLAHELQHAFHHAADPTEETWVNEGLAELASELAGYRPTLVQEFARRPSTSLTEWADDPYASGPHYGAAHLFMRYLFQHYGGRAHIPLLVHEPADGIAGVEAFLRRIGAGKTFPEVFQDWAVANLLGNGDGPLFYKEGAPRLSAPKGLEPGQRIQDILPPFAASYVNLPPTAGGTLTFSGEASTPLADLPVPSGEACWFSNRGDNINTRLTRTLDLTGVERATLRFRIWYDLEEWWDYAYAAVSADGGRSWDALKGKFATAHDPLGVAFGPGWTGSSNGWREEEVDLTPFAGRRVLLRFEYVTDEAVNLGGLCLDDFSIPEIGWQDDAEHDRDWLTEGWIRRAPHVPTVWRARLVVERPEGGPMVHDLPVDAAGRGRWTVRIPPNARRAVLVVLNLTPLARRPAPFQITWETAQAP